MEYPRIINFWDIPFIHTKYKEREKVLMKIYSFEFVNQPIKWYRNEFKDMVFLGTESRRFPQNRNFIRFDENILTPDVNIDQGSHYKPIIDIPDKNIIVHMSRKTGDTSIDLFDGGSIQDDFDLAIITIDKTHYRLIDWYLSDLSHEIIKVKDTESNDIAVVKLKDSGSKLEMVLILYNKLFKQYEYFEIRYKKNENGIRTLICRDRTKQAGTKIMDEWKQFDLENSSKGLKHHAPFTYSINKFFTNYLVCKKEDIDEVCELVPEWVDIIPIDEINESSFMKGTKAFTSYNIEYFTNSEFEMFEKIGIRYYFIMDSTGKITT